jgi:hypothetical protein
VCKDHDYLSEVTMTPAHWVALLSAVLGTAGTIILFFGSYSLEPREGAVWGGPEVDKWNAARDVRNAKRIVRQRIGLAFLCASFFAQGVAVFLV